MEQKFTENFYGIAGLLVLFFCGIFIAFAYFSRPSAAPLGATQAVELVLDQDSRSFRFIIDGVEVARIDSAALHIRDSINYGGVVTDVGVGNYLGATSGSNDSDALAAPRFPAESP